MGHKSLAIMVLVAMYFGLLREENIGGNRMADIGMVIVVLIVVINHFQNMKKG
ncbi:MAG: hypothetical protein RSE47_07905 [Acidaminococcaceae bacterium]